MTFDPNIIPDRQNVYSSVDNVDNQSYGYDDYGGSERGQDYSTNGHQEHYQQDYQQVEQQPDHQPESQPYEANYETYDQPGLVPHRSILRDIFEILLLIVTIYTLVNLATARAVVEGQSMQPNFYTGQLVIVNRFAYYFATPQRGDVIVLHDPKDPSQDFIKRVMALPNETVELREGRVYINGVLMEEPYIAQFCTGCPNDKWTLKADEYFVLGDNRNNSFDSHSFGPINRHLIVGQAWIRYWPIPDIGFIQHPRYADIPATAPAQVPTAAPTEDTSGQPAY